MPEHPKTPRLVILESPYAGDIAANVAYARACLRDCLMRGEAPIASHLLYTQAGVLRDEDPAERALGIAAGLAWLRGAEASVVYVDRGISDGMRQGIEAAQSMGRPVEFRSLFAKKGEAAPLQPAKPVSLSDARAAQEIPGATPAQISKPNE